MKRTGTHIAATAAVALSCGLAASTTARAASLLDGRYTCLMAVGSNTVTFGFVDIKGRTYRDPSLGAGGPFAPYGIGPGGAIQWSRGFGALSANGARLGTTDVSSSTRFVVHYLSPRGRQEGLDCARE
ncbi:MAG TPA: hypothetical protein VII63_12715 [Caulobacteraceae bacterium]